MPFNRQCRILVVACMLVIASTVAGQGTGRIEGVIVDPAGARIAGAKIVVSSRANSQEIQTNEIGEFKFALAAGTYQIAVECAGFKVTKLRNLRVQSGHTQTIRIAPKLLKQGKCPKGQLCL
jgi:hypothetical protein